MYEGYGAQFPTADHPEAFPDVQPYPAPPAIMPPAGNGLRNLVGQFLNNPGTNVNILRIEPGPNGRFEVWIALGLADIFRIEASIVVYMVLAITQCSSLVKG